MPKCKECKKFKTNECTFPDVLPDDEACPDFISKNTDEDEILSQEEFDLATKDEMTIKELKEILGLTIKHDDFNKVITFLCMLSAYTDDSQFNISFRAESSTGKSYIPLEIAQLFPRNDVIEIAYASPSSFFHEHGVRDEETGEYIIDLERKILIFVDMPHDELLVRLRPLLSHDRKELHYKITDKSSKGKLRTKRIKIIGFPAVVFCTGKLSVKDQEATRLILLSPETSQEKIREGIYLRALREADKEAFKEWLESNPKRQLLKKRILAIKQANIRNIKVPDWEVIASYFIENGKLKPRYMRDVARLIYIVKALALLNFRHREVDEDGSIIANEKDIETALQLYENIYESQQLGIPPYVYNIYKEIILPKYNELGRGLTKIELMKAFYEKYGRLLEEWRIKKEIIPALQSAGLITIEINPMDKRERLFTPVIKEGGETPQPISTVTLQSIDELRSKILELRSQGLSIREIAKLLNVSHMKVYRELKALKEKCNVTIETNRGSIPPNSEKLDLASTKRMLYNYVERNLPFQRELLEWIENNIPNGKEALAELIREGRIIETFTADGEIRIVPYYLKGGMSYA